MSQLPMTQEDQDNAKEWARIRMREYEHYGVPMDLLPGEGEVTRNPHPYRDRESDGSDFLMYTYTYTVVFRGQWAIEIDEMGDCVRPPYRVR